MNHFRVAAGRGAEFETIWRGRNSYLDTTEGFLAFHLLRGETAPDGSESYASHSTWASREAFVAWTESEAFRKAHSQGRMPAGLLLGPPRFEGWEAVEAGS
jgi:heme-degrading monooxygenase HmoA